MTNVANLIKQPKEAEFEIVIAGNFNPDLFDSFWLFKEGLLGEKESADINHKEFKKGEQRKFSTQFIEVEINKETFTIGIVDFNHYDLQTDFLLGIMEKFKNSLNDFFRINLRLHYVFNKNSEKVSFLNSLINEKWSDFVEGEKSEAFGIRIAEPASYDNYDTEKILSVTKCFRPDLGNPIHVHTFNQFQIKGKKQIGDILTHDLVLETLNSSILNINKFFEKFDSDGLS